MADCDIKAELDSTEFWTAHNELRSLLKQLPDELLKIINLLIGIANGSIHPADIESRSAAGTLVMALKPSQGLCDLLAALRALDSDRRILE